MEGEEEENKSTKAAGCKKNATTRLQRSLLHLSRALGKLHGRRGHATATANANGQTPRSSSSSTATSFLSGCMHPRTHSFASGRRRHRHNFGDDDGGGSGEAHALAVNFRSLRVGVGLASAAAVAGDDESGSSSSSSAQEYCYAEDGVSEADEPKAVVVRGAGVAMATLSAAPYEDFRRSMREMVDAAAGSETAGSAPVDWDFMEELLFCYLRLNDRAVHKDILRAFTDTVAAIRRRRRRRWAARSRRTRRRARRQPRAGGDARGDCDGAKKAPVTSS